MQMIRPLNLKFGLFEADLRTGELTRLGKRIRLQGQPFQLLAMLLEQPGVLVTREELHLKLWPETSVDFDHRLNKAISKIREALGDSAEIPGSSRQWLVVATSFLPTLRVSETSRPALRPLISRRSRTPSLQACSTFPHQT